MNILIMGGPGAGKGTMSSKIVETFDLVHISTGDIFRSEIKEQTELGKLAKEYMDQGLLVPDDVTNSMVQSFLQKTKLKNGFLLDGYPRTIDQAKAFDQMTKGTSLTIDKVLALNIDFSVLSDRITGRRICKTCGEIYHIHNHPPKVEGICDKDGGELYQRADDTEESLKTRLNEYVNQTAPVLDYYDEKGIVSYIEAANAMEVVWGDVKNAISASLV